MAQAQLPLDTPLSLPEHPKAWKWYDYFTFNVDHKVIGIQYLVTAFIFYLIGGLMAVAMRTELATADSDFLNPNLYNAFMTNHGTIMIFFWVVPAAIGGFGNYLVPLMIGARDMAFPRLNALAFWLNPPGGGITLGQFPVWRCPSGLDLLSALEYDHGHYCPEYVDSGDRPCGYLLDHGIGEFHRYHLEDESA